MSVLENIKERIEESNSIVILTHEHPDGDAIGSSLAFMHGLKKIGKFCFVSTTIKEIFIPGNVNEIAPSAFQPEKDIDLSISLENQTYTVVDNMYLLSKDEKTLKLVSKNQDSYVVPSSVTTIGINAFYAKSNLKNIEILGNINKIGGGAFDYCSNLETITIGPNIKEISSTAFTRCDKLTTIKVQNKKDSIKNAPWGAPYGLRAVKWAE